jgi:DNA processing protein
LTEDRVLVVSGLAEGIDRSAHLATMEAGGRTIAVLGTSLSAVYPAKHRAFLKPC